MLALAVIGTAFRQGRRRARWLGASRFGVGYLLLVSGHSDEMTWPQYATNQLLMAIRPWLPPIMGEYPAATYVTAAANARVLNALDQTVPMPFSEKTPLADVLKYIEAITRGPEGREVPIYVDPIGLQAAEKTMQSTVSIDVRDVPMRTTLRLILKQLGMIFQVRDGLLIITDENTADLSAVTPAEDPYLLIGQCVLTWLAAGLGSVLAPRVCDPDGPGDA